jgi:hypothetical protein
MVAMTKVSPRGPRFSVCSTPVIATCRSNSGAELAEGCSTRGTIRAPELAVGEVRGNGEAIGTLLAVAVFFGDEISDQSPTPASATTTAATIAMTIRAGPNLAQRRPNARTDRFDCADKGRRLMIAATKTRRQFGFE